jgi:adenine-specific DNA-methyltransferase
MSRLADLLRQLRGRDPQLADDILNEVKALELRREFGLNFERHTPEIVELPGRPIRKGDKVCFLPARGESPTTDTRRLWRVVSIQGAAAERIATLVAHNADSAVAETTTRPVGDLVVVAEFRDPIYPGLRSTGTIERGGDKPFHAVINSENYHALQSLLYTHEGKVDAIYIDPPYNTGNKDWKYNNDYVDGEDIYRHSKWLAFMERRLKIAKRLLNPADSVLVVTIDEKEYLRLGMLLQQVFPDQRTQMVSIIINRSGTPRKGEFSRVEEYAFFVYFGACGPTRTGDSMLGTEVETGDDLEPADEPGSLPVRWDGLMRSGTNARRQDRERSFYPIYLDSTTGKYSHAGAFVPLGISRDSVDHPEGLTAHWPIRSDGTEGRWQLSPAKLNEAFARGTARVGSRVNEFGMRSFSYLKDGQLRKIRSGEIVVNGNDAQGALILAHAEDVERVEVPRTVWNRQSHSAADHGSSLLRKFIPGRSFPFPKSLYAVEDTLRFFVKDKPDAVVLDFFGGSGTTAHAIMRLNKQDGGRRQSITVTNNEVSPEEQEALRLKNLRPGDDDWESLGICDYVTKPRLSAAITGLTPSGKPVKGDYKFVDEFPMSEGFEENIEFFTLTYEAPRIVAHNRAFEAVAPLLWLKAGAQGSRIDKAAEKFEVADTYAVLFDLDASLDFIQHVSANQSVRMAFIVTDDDRSYQMICGELPKRVEPVRLYESYLSNFTINTGRE